MLKLDDKYKVDIKLPMKDFIPKELKPAVKKKIKDNVKSCTLSYQIIGEEIPSVINDEYNVWTIQFYDLELVDIKKATFLANMYQTIIKSPCVLRLHDNSKEVYSFALKRLSQTDNTQIVVTDTLVTSDFYTTITSTDKKELENHLALDNLIGKQNKVTTYLEMYVKAYILTNSKVYANSKEFLMRKDIWYSESKVRKLYANLRGLELLKLSLVKASGNIEKVKLNKKIKNHISCLEEC
ncbi:DUF4391 domain-containing protein [Tannockella kyphosi]|uniref:DUF4391 domain-containing protein n=1 Tax=Tannockella kyphosi TaxID=2899121 RepID=UPI002011DC0F|nr:DUF4391 domain-containing protein [Tannockella kyphosi]